MGLSALACSGGQAGPFGPGSQNETAGDATEGGAGGKSGPPSAASGGRSNAAGGRAGTPSSGASDQSFAGSTGLPGGGLSSTGTGGNPSTAGGGLGTDRGGAATTTGAACDNGLDDDGDGLVDGSDPECTGPRDNIEESFATGIPGDNRDPKWQDCFFDGNSGAGDDRCRYSTDCLHGTLKPDHPDCQVSAACLNYCKPLTQNGCDCFGCCSVRRTDGSSVDIQEAASCSLASIDDVTACPRCTKSTACSNDCGECELCAGKTAADLPKSCSTPGTGGAGGMTGAGGSTARGGAAGSGGTGTPPPPNHVCDNGEPVCGPGLPRCPGSDQYCSLGCCIVTIR